MSDERADVIVIGAGPAGSAAAMAAAGCGLATVVLDEAAQAGGQIYRAPPASWQQAGDPGPGADFAAGQALRARLRQSGARHITGHAVWAVAPEFEVRTAASDGERSWHAPRLIVATGVTERIMPFPGWTTPGVIGLAAATVLLKAQQVLPGRNTLVCGAGPLVYAVAAGILAGGGRVAAVADLASRADWARTVPALARAPALARRGLGWMASLRRSGVRMLWRHRLASVSGADRVEGAVLEAIDAFGAAVPGAPPVRIEADTVVVGHGLVPSIEVTRLLRARHRFVPERGGWIPERDDEFRTSVSGLYVAGDCAGVAGALAAEASGTIAGLAAAHDAGALQGERFRSQAAESKALHAAADRVGGAMSRMMALRPGLVDAATPDTVVCRCEDVTRRLIEDAVAAGAVDSNQVKAWTRCGMGPCQGRTCGDAVGEILGRRFGGREKAGVWTARVPIRPQPLEQLASSLSYDEIWSTPAARVAASILPAENVAPSVKAAMGIADQTETAAADRREGDRSHVG